MPVINFVAHVISDLEGTIDDILEDRPKPRKSTGWDRLNV